MTRSLAGLAAGWMVFATAAGCATTDGRAGAESGAAGVVRFDEGSDWQSVDPMQPVESDTSIERQVAAYFALRGIQAEYREQNGSGRVVVTYLADGLQWRVILDTTDTSHGQPARAIGLILDTDYKIEGTRDIVKALAVLNNFHLKRWAGTFYFDPSDHEITGQWYINLPAVSVHPELVADAVKRLSGSWVELHRELEEVLRTEVETQPAQRRPQKRRPVKGAIDA